MKQAGSHSTHLTFLSYGEDLLQNKILQNQFIEFAKSFDSKKYTSSIFSAVPISRSRLKQNQRWNDDLTALMTSLTERNIVFTVSTLPALANWLYSSVWQILFFHNPYHYLKLYLFLRRQNTDYIYARGYHAALAANILKGFLPKKPHVQFDPRGLFIEEGVYLGKLGVISKRLWKRLERFLYEKSDVVTFVSEPFQDLLNENYKIKNPLVVYTHADIGKFSLDPQKQFKKLRFVYLGQLDNTGWHHTKYLLQLFKALNKDFIAELLVVTQSDGVDILAQAKALGLEGQVTVERAKNATEVAALLKTCHVALMCYKETKSYEEEAIGRTMVASKSGEYLAAGLPMICNEKLRGIADLIERYGIGLTYQVGDESSVAPRLQPLLKDYAATSAKCREIAQNYFDLRTNVKTIEDEIDQLCAR